MDSGIDAFKIVGYAWVIESFTKRKVTVVGYGGDIVKNISQLERYYAVYCVDLILLYVAT